MTRAEVLGFFERSVVTDTRIGKQVRLDQGRAEEYPVVVVWEGGRQQPGLVCTGRVECSHGLPVLVMRDDRGAEYAFGSGDLAARAGMMLRLCDDDTMVRPVEMMSAAIRAGFGFLTR